MQPDADILVGLVRERAQVDVGSETVAHAQLDAQLAQFRRRVRERHHQDARGLGQPRVVGTDFEQVEFLLARAPKPAHTFEAAGTILQSVREQTDFRVVVAREASVVVDGQVSELHGLAVLRLYQATCARC